MRFGRQCVFTPIQKRRPRKRTDARVAELEKEMVALRSMLMPQSSILSTSEELNHSSLPIKSYAIQSTYSEPAGKDESNETDPVTRGWLSMATARQLVEMYKSRMYPQYPIVYIPPTCSADDLRRTKPTLFLAVLAGAAGTEHPELATKLDQAILEEYANRTVLGSEKSLELIKCLLVSSSWYQPPTRLNQYKYSEYVHMAGMMAMDIGIASRPLNQDSSTNESTANIDSRRTFLAVLVKSAGTTITSRKQPMMRINSHYANECLYYLEESPQALPGDRILTAWTRLLIIADEIGKAFVFDDPGEVASIFDIKTQLMISAFKKRLTDWRHDCAQFESSPSPLQMTYYAVRLYLSEVALHVDHRPEDFRVPYRMSAFTPCNDQPIPVKPVVEALAELLDNAHALLDVFMSVEPTTARTLPLGMFVRASYGAFILAKLCASAVLEQSQLAPLIDYQQLNAESYMDRTLLHVRCAIGTNGCRLPAIFLNLMSQMREWCIQPQLLDKLDGEVQTGNSVSPRGNISSTTSVEHAFSSSNSPETYSSGSNTTTTALTGTFEANYERFGNDQVVKSASFHGRSDQTLDISNTLAMVKTALSGIILEDELCLKGNAPSTEILSVANTDTVTLGDGKDTQWSSHMDEIWNNDSTFSMLDNIDEFLDSEMIGLDDAHT